MSRQTIRVRLFAPLASLSLVLALGACGEDTVSSGPANVEADVADDADAVIDINTNDVPVTEVAADSGPEVQVDTGIDTGSDTGSICPGGAGCSCEESSACDSGKCIDTPDGKKCAKTCGDGGCEPGYACKPLSTGGTDTTTYCVPNFLALCAPCTYNKDCQVQGATDAMCIGYGADGKFCGGACSVDTDCPTAYACSDITDEGTGKTSKQCKLKKTSKDGSGADCSADPAACADGESCVSGKCVVLVQPACECSAWAKQAGLTTTCDIKNASGSCSAVRKCTPDGLEACKAKVPTAEVCNADDDNCDGKIDNLAADFQCFKAAYKDGGSATPCATAADCLNAGEGCNKDTGKCALLIGKCFGKPTCAANGELICNDTKVPKIESCNGDDDDCDGEIDEDFSWNSPEGTSVKVNSSCGVGSCSGGTVLCKDLLTALCSTAAAAGSEGCDGIDNDCNGKIDDLACDDKNPCTDDVCDSGAKSCTNPPNAGPCDDKNACTLTDTCAAGACVGEAKDCDDKDQCTENKCDPTKGTCSNPKYAGSCEDGNACTVGDTCGLNAAAAYVCISGKDALKCDDSNVCTDDVCNTQKGCVNSSNAEAVVCYSGDEKTKGVGTCKSGKKACIDGKLDAVCAGEVAPNKAETCDGKDDNCDGKTDEGCKPTSVAVTFSSAYVSGKSGNVTVQMLVGPSGPVGKAKGNGKYDVDFGFLAWLMSLVGGK